VSKALIHYHFRNREALLARLVETLAAGVVARERAALVDAPPAAAVDRLWAWLADELTRGDVRVLAELAGMPAPEVRRPPPRPRGRGTRWRRRRWSASSTCSGCGRACRARCSRR
jgi:AcrR family transcriptional regulator